MIISDTSNVIRQISYSFSRTSHIGILIGNFPRWSKTSILIKECRG
nr:MAG TPA: hypothetical protein [Bacteriophage sp.]